MSRKHSRRFRALSVVFFLIFLVLLLKLGIGISQLLLPKKDAQLTLFASEVMAEDRKAKPAGKGQQPKADAAAPAAVQEAPGRPASNSVPDMMSYLEQRDAELKKKEEELRRKEEYLSQMEQDVEKKFKELISIQKEIQAYRTEKEEGQNAKVRSLSKIYGTMKPKEAAKLLENLEDPLVVEIISTMSAGEAANILSNMDVKKAAKISQFLTQK